MPFQGGSYIPDNTSIMERLYGVRSYQQKLAQMKEQQALEQQRKKIMAEGYQPAQAGQTVNALTPEQAEANMLGFFQSGGKDPSQLPAATQQIEAKPASFDSQSTINKLYGVGDIEGADKLIAGDYRQALGNRATSGGSEKWYGNSKLVKGPGGKAYRHVTSSAGGSKLIPLDGDPMGELKLMDLDGKKVWANSYTGEPVREFDVVPTDYQSWQMDDNAQAEQARLVEQAKTEGKGAGERSVDGAAQNTDIDKQIGLIDRIAELAEGGFYGSTLGDRARLAGTTATGAGSGSKEYINTKNMQMMARRLLLAAKPKGSGNPTEGEWKMYGETIADPSQYPDAKTYLQALDNYKQVLSGQRPMPEQYRERHPSAPAGNKPAAGPLPSMPNPAQHKGRTIRDTNSGITYKSDGSRWMRVK